MMWQLDDIAGEIDLTPRMHRGKPCRGLCLDVAGEQQAERRV